MVTSGRLGWVGMGPWLWKAGEELVLLCSGTKGAALTSNKHTSDDGSGDSGLCTSPF